MAESIIKQIQKGIISPEDVKVGGNLTPEASSKLLSMIIKENDFLKKITYIPMGKLKKDIDVLDIANGILVRVSEGTEPDVAKIAGISNLGKTLYALDVQLFFSLKFSTIRDHKNDPDYENKIVKEYTTKFGNELLYLGCIGTKDDNSNGFETLNKGWLQIAKESTKTHKIDTNGTISSYVDLFENMLSEMPSKYLPNSVFIMSNKDRNAYIKEVGEQSGGVGYIVSGNANDFMGYPIISVPYWPEKEPLLTPIKNIVFGAVNDVEKYREIRARKRVIDWTYVIYNDYEIAIDDAVVVAYDIP